MRGKKNMGTKIILKCEREVFSGQADSVVWRWILLQKGIEIESSRPLFSEQQSVKGRGERGENILF